MDTVRYGVSRKLTTNTDAATLDESVSILLRWSVEARVDALLKTLYTDAATPSFRRQLNPGESPYITDVRGVS